MTVLILHGIGGHAGMHWQQWLYDELMKRGYQVIMPTMPGAGHPDRKEWLLTVKNLIRDIPAKELIIVTHSLGAATAMDYLEQAKERVLGLVCVSPAVFDYGAELNSYFLKEKDINFEKVNKNLEKAEVFYGDNDPYVPQEKLELAAKSFNAKPQIVPNGGHLNAMAGFTEFPELLKTITDNFPIA